MFSQLGLQLKKNWLLKCQTSYFANLSPRKRVFYKLWEHMIPYFRYDRAYLNSHKRVKIHTPFTIQRVQDSYLCNSHSSLTHPKESRICCFSVATFDFLYRCHKNSQYFSPPAFNAWQYTTARKSVGILKKKLWLIT